MSVCGFSACPADAIEEVKECVDYVCKNIGGHGAVRELIDMIKKELIKVADDKVEFCNIRTD